MLVGEPLPAGATLGAVDVDHQPAGRPAGWDADVGPGVALPPGPDVLTVRAGVLEAVRAGGRDLALDAEREHRQADRGVVQGGVAAVAHDAPPSGAPKQVQIPVQGIGTVSLFCRRQAARLTTTGRRGSMAKAPLAGSLESSPWGSQPRGSFFGLTGSARGS